MRLERALTVAAAPMIWIATIGESPRLAKVAQLHPVWSIKVG